MNITGEMLKLTLQGKNINYDTLDLENAQNINLFREIEGISLTRMFHHAHLVFAHILTCVNIQDGSRLSNAVSNEACFQTVFSTNTK